MMCFLYIIRGPQLPFFVVVAVFHKHKHTIEALALSISTENTGCCMDSHSHTHTRKHIPRCVKNFPSHTHTKTVVLCPIFIATFKPKNHPLWMVRWWLYKSYQHPRRGWFSFLVSSVNADDLYAHSHIFRSHSLL